MPQEQLVRSITPNKKLGYPRSAGVEKRTSHKGMQILETFHPKSWPELLLIMAWRHETDRYLAGLTTKWESTTSVFVDKRPCKSQPDPFPIVCEETQCICYIGNKRFLLERRKRRFRRVSHMWSHVKNVHLSKISPGEQLVCGHP